MISTVWKKLSFTFHSGYILMKKHLALICQLFQLYIPFWLYSNETARKLNSAGYSFTFHSGYILIVVWYFYWYLFYYFTFHSGYILIYPHCSAIALAIPFTFHSGYILIIISTVNAVYLTSLHSILVIF